MQAAISQQLKCSGHVDRHARRGAKPAARLVHAQCSLKNDVQGCSTSGRVLESSRRSLLLAGLAGLVCTGAPLQAGAAMDQEFVRRGLVDYDELLDSGKLTQKSVESLRSKYNFKRSFDGRVWVKSSKGEWYAVRLDMEVPGTLLFRSPAGKVYALQTDALQQIDLSDDRCVMMMLSDGEWEGSMTPIEVENADTGATEVLTLSEQEFRNLVGLVGMAEEDGEEAGKGQ